MKKNNIDTIEDQGVWGNPSIRKKMLISANEQPNIHAFGQAVFQQGQQTTPHAHEDMTEVFFIQSGKGLFHSDAETVEVKAGDVITVEIGEEHWQENPHEEELIFLYFGVKA
jgi:mannose-6-phosphate isomerase-like protein (cupin superfamily)